MLANAIRLVNKVKTINFFITILNNPGVDFPDNRQRQVGRLFVMQGFMIIFDSVVKGLERNRTKGIIRNHSNEFTGAQAGNL